MQAHFVTCPYAGRATGRGSPQPPVTRLDGILPTLEERRPMLPVERDAPRRGERLFQSPMHRPGGDSPAFATPIAAGMERPPAIVMTNATKHFGRLTALED